MRMPSVAQLIGPGVVVIVISGGIGAAWAADPLPAPPPITASPKAPPPSWGKPLPYPVVIADRRNNRLIEVAPWGWP